MDALKLLMNLQQRIDKTISAIDAIADLLPGVIIIHNIPDGSVRYMSPRGLRFLNTTLEELQALKAGYHSKYFNPNESAEYVPGMLALLERNDLNEAYTFFQQSRQSDEQPWNWYLSSIKVLLQDDDGTPVLAITIAQNIDPLHHLTSKVSRLLDENNFLRKNQHIFAMLTRKEREIVKLMAVGQSSKQIAQTLFISEQTAQTHRRNIKAKLGAASDYDITKFAQAFDLI
jgi:DNA-binding CsgD family transcriptional regulator